MIKQIEVEFRALLTPGQFTELEKFLQANGQDLGEDNKELTFFLLPGKLLKVVKATTTKTAKISLKLGRFGQGHGFEELEISIKPEEVERAIQMFDRLGYKEYQKTLNQRHNYLYQGVEFALKVGDQNTWDHHLEMEILASNSAEQSAAEEKIKNLANELKIKLMTNDDLAVFEEKIKKIKNLKENE